MMNYKYSSTGMKLSGKSGHFLLGGVCWKVPRCRRKPRVEITQEITPVIKSCVRVSFRDHSADVMQHLVCFHRGEGTFFLYRRYVTHPGSPGEGGVPLSRRNCRFVSMFCSLDVKDTRLRNVVAAEHVAAAFRF